MQTLPTILLRTDVDRPVAGAPWARPRILDLLCRNRIAPGLVSAKVRRRACPGWHRVKSENRLRLGLMSVQCRR